MVLPKNSALAYPNGVPYGAHSKGLGNNVRVDTWPHPRALDLAVDASIAY